MLLRQVETGTFGRPGVQISACSRNGGVPEGGLDQVNGGAAVKRMTGVGVAHPMGRDFLLQPSVPRSGINYTADLRHVECSPAFAAPKDGVDRLGVSLKREKLLPHFGLEQNRARFSAFAEDGN